MLSVPSGGLWALAEEQRACPDPGMPLPEALSPTEVLEGPFVAGRGTASRAREWALV